MSPPMNPPPDATTEDYTHHGVDGFGGDDGDILVDGFQTIVNAAAACADDEEEDPDRQHKRRRRRVRQKQDQQHLPLQWHCAPDSWSTTAATKNPESDDGSKEKEEGEGGSWSVSSSPDDTCLTIVPPSKKDYWRNTYYEPILIKDDGPFLYASLDYCCCDSSRDEQQQQQQPNYYYYTIETKFCLTACSQFDQAGIMMRINSHNWIKTGIEVVDQKPKLSCVVTRNNYSDWSTQSWPQSSHDDEDDHKANNANVTKSKEAGAAVQTEAEIRVHCRGTSYVVEANFVGGGGGDGQQQQRWEFIRIAHMDNMNNDNNNNESNVTNEKQQQQQQLWAGVFACCPQDQNGGRATFTKFRIMKGSKFDHHN